MGGDQSKDLPDDDTIDNTFDSQAPGSKMNMTLTSGKGGDGKSTRSGGK